MSNRVPTLDYSTALEKCAYMYNGISIIPTVFSQHLDYYPDSEAQAVHYMKYMYVHTQAQRVTKVS